jgi:uncharacterized protein (TIRG00374 family)
LTDTADTPARGRSLRRWLQLLLSLLVLSVLARAAFVALEGPEVRAALQRFDRSYLPLILSMSLLYLCLATLRFITLVAPLTNVPGWALARGYLAAQPTALVPGGLALRVAMLRRLGVRGACSTAALLNASALDQLLLILVTAVAALWFPKARLVAALMLGLIAVLAVLLALPATRHGLTRLLRRLACYLHWEGQVDRFVESIALVANQRTLWLASLLTVAALGAAVLEFSLVLQSLDVRAPFWTALLAYALPTMLARVIPTPGGLGVTEGGMIGVMSTVANINRNTAAAGSALFRVSDSGFQALVGALIYLVFWRGSAERDWLPGEARAALECRKHANNLPRLKDAVS